MGNTIVGSEQHVKTGFLGDPEKVAVFQGGPSLLSRRSDGMTGKKTRYWHRGTLVKENAHLPGKRGRFKAAGGEVENSFHLFPRQPIIQLNEFIDCDAIFQILKHR